jgi:Domain of unknown function (DUF4384)
MLKIIDHKILLTIICMFFVLTMSISAQSGGEWYIGEGTVSTEALPWNKAVEQALQEARRDAMQEAAGINVTVSNFRLQQEVNTQDIVDLYAKMIRTTSSGIIVAEKNITPENIPGTPPKCKVTGEFKVVSATGDPDPEFELRMKINGRDDVVNLNDQDEIKIEVSATKDCYVTIFNLFSNDSMLMLFPNSFMPDNSIMANRKYTIFPDSLSSQITLRAGLLPGHVEDAEYLIAVATKKQYPLPFEFNRESFELEFKHFADAIIQIGNWLVGIPIGERAEADLVYYIRK